MAYTDSDHVVNRASGRLALYFLRGAEAAPGAVAFDLIALDAEGNSTGAGATVCRDCVSRVSAEAFACMFGTSPPVDPDLGTWKAILDVGAAPAYDLAPQSELQYDTYCAECEVLIIGNHVRLQWPVVHRGPPRGSRLLLPGHPPPAQAARRPPRRT